MPKPIAAVEREPPADTRAAERNGSASTSYLLANVHHALRARLEAALKPANITPLQFTILEVLAAHEEGATSADLSRRFFVTPQTMGETIANLVRRGLVDRAGQPGDRRVLTIFLTKLGRETIRLGEAELRRIEAEVFANLAPADLAALRRLLGAAVQRIREDRGPAGGP